MAFKSEITAKIASKLEKKGILDSFEHSSQWHCEVLVFLLNENESLNWDEILVSIVGTGEAYK